MGRVYEALKRAAEQNGAESKREEARAAETRDEKSLAPAESNGNHAAEEPARAASIRPAPGDSRGNGAPAPAAD
ncbi:MAG TPA: hypothetical protein VE713_16205, partial [Pyrinomonadaceae bacterium]|nr:hypothetical protein [Pyrinomonadaceae bacterium]